MSRCRPGSAAAIFMMAVATLGSCSRHLVAQGGGDTVPLTFKGFSLGMSLEDFRSKASGDFANAEVLAPKKNGGYKMRTDRVPTPVCTGSNVLVDGVPDETHLGPHEVVCNISQNGANLSQREVAGQPMSQILYRFNNSRLYAIEISFRPLYYPLIRHAFLEKYGTPRRTSSESFENGYGARWIGEAIAWQSGDQWLVLREGSGNGPSQDNMNPVGSGAFFEDRTLSPVPAKGLPKDF